MRIHVIVPLLIFSVSLVSCLRPATPDDDLLSGILLGDVAAVQQALESGADINKVYQDGTTALMHACIVTRNYRGEAGADASITVKVDLDNSEMRTDAQVSNVHASHSARTKNGDPEMVRLLIARGADVNAKDREGQTPLSMATNNNLSEIADILRKAGAKD